MRRSLGLLALLFLASCVKPPPDPPPQPPVFQPKAGVDYVDRQLIAIVDLTQADLKPGETLTGKMSNAGNQVNLQLKDWFFLPGNGKYACGKIMAIYETKVPKDSVFDKAEELEDANDLFKVNPRLIAYYGSKSQAILPPFDPFWALKAINAPENATAEDLRVAVIDTGLDKDIPISSIDPMNTIDNTSNVADQFFDPVWNEMVGHGTGISAIIAGRPFPNGQGGDSFRVSVAKYATIIPIKAAADNGTATLESVAKGVCYAVLRGAKVINMSMGNRVKSSILRDVIRDANLAGVTIVASAGNSNDDPNKLERNIPNYPAAFASELPNVIAVGAIDKSKKAAEFTNRNDYVDLVAPGVNVFTHSASTEPGFNRVYYPDGTSFSAGYVTGAVAILYAIARDCNYFLTPVQAKQIIMNTTTDISDTCTDPLACGKGLLNVEKAIQKIKELLGSHS